MSFLGVVILLCRRSWSNQKRSTTSKKEKRKKRWLDALTRSYDQLKLSADGQKGLILIRHLIAMGFVAVSEFLQLYYQQNSNVRFRQCPFEGKRIEFCPSLVGKRYSYQRKWEVKNSISHWEWAILQKRSCDSRMMMDHITPDAMSLRRYSQQVAFHNLISPERCDVARMLDALASFLWGLILWLQRASRVTSQRPQQIWRAYISSASSGKKGHQWHMRIRNRLTVTCWCIRTSGENGWSPRENIVYPITPLQAASAANGHRCQGKIRSRPKSVHPEFCLHSIQAKEAFNRQRG